MTSGVLDGKVIVPHYEYDGMDFILTRDIAKMNRDGIMEFLERKIDHLQDLMVSRLSHMNWKIC